MTKLGGWELIIALAIGLLVFGVGRLGKIGAELGQGIRAFREEIAGDSQTDEKKTLSFQ